MELDIQVWFNLQAEYSPQAECSPQVNGTENKTSPAFSFHEFASHGESSDVTEGSDLSEYSQRSSLSVHKFSRLGESSQQGSSLSGQELSQYSLQSSMDANPSSETVSSHDSPDISQQESTLSDGQYGCDEGNSTSSLHDSPHDEAVSSAIMEVSGELMLGKFSSHRQGSGGSESSDISDEDMRRTPSGGAIAKYPESSTGLSDNDWNPYATESDTNQTPRSPRSAASDEQNRVGFVSKATFSITQPTDSMTTVTMTTGEVTVGEPKPERFVLSDRDSRFTDDIEMTGRKTSERLDILRYVIDDDDDEQANDRTTDIVGKESRSQEAYVIHESPDTARSGYTDGSRSGRQSTESCKSLDSLRRESTESGLTIRSQESTLESCRPSLEFDRQAEYESRESAELARHLPDKRVSTRSSLQSWESGPDGRSSRSDFDKSGESGFSGRQSADSQHSGESQKSTGRSIGSELSDRLERLSDAAGDNLKELIEFESAQRAVDAQIQDLGEATSKSLQLPKQDDSGDSVSRTRFTARIEHDASPVRSTQSPERCSNVTSNGYISIAERERLLYSESSDINQQVRKTNEEKVDTRYDRTADATYDSPDISQPVRRTNEVKVDTRYDRKTDADFERSRPSHSSTNLPKFSEALTDRSPSDISMKRVAKLFDDTKRQVREAVAIPRPEPSGSEERFPLHERLMWPAHDDSFKMQDRSGELEKRGKPQDSEAASSLTSEEVARVLGRYVNDDVSRSQRMGRSHEDTGTSVQNSAFDRIDSDGLGTSGALQIRHYAVPDTLNSLRAGEVSDDELSKHVKALLTETGHLGIVSENDGQRNEYVPRTMDYTRLQKDLQEIQDCLHDVPPPAANDSIHIQRRNHRDCLKAEAECTPRDELRSLEITGTTSGGRESGVSEYGRRLVWDHGADLEYDEGYGGQFIGTTTTTNTFSPRLIGTGDTDILIVRPDSAVTDETLNDAPEPDETKTWTGSGITRAEKIVEQIMSRRAEGDLKESVEDIIARYKNEQKDLFDRLQAPAHPQTSQPDRDAKSEDIKPVAKIYRPIFKDPNMELHVPSSQQNGISIEQPDGKKQPGLAERVYKILTSENGSVDNSDSPEEKGMAKKVYKILASDRPHEQANGILTEAMANEHEILKHLVTRPKDDSSVEDSGLNGTTESFDIEDKDVRKQLQWSQFSSPDKGEKSDFAALQEVTSAPYLALSNAKSLLSTQLKKMSERNFDKSIEIRTPYQQVECYPVYGVDRLGQQGPDSSAPREAWMPARRSAGSTSRDRDRALASDRFFLTEKDHVTKDLEAPQQRMRTYSDPFEVSPSKRSTSSIREGHARSRSEEAGNVSELSEYSFAEPEYSPAERRSTQSPRNLRPGTLATPQRHRPQEWSFECYTSVSDSSDPRHQSDSSDGYVWRNCGYQLYDGLHHPQNDVCVSDSPKNPTKNVTRKYVSDEEVTQGENGCGLNLNGDLTNSSPVESNSNPVKSTKQVRLSRMREKKSSNQKVKFECEGQMSKSLPSYYANLGFIEKVPISTDDVYELLTRSQAQEQKLAELQNRLLRQQDITQNSSSSSTHLPSDQGEISSSNKAYKSKEAQGKKLHKAIFMKKGCLQQDGSPSPTESDTSGSKKGARLRPYRPAGSRDLYYTESGDDTNDTNDSGTTAESTHPGSDDAAPPYIPSQYLGSRRIEPSKHAIGIYGNKEKDNLSSIDENFVKIQDEKVKAVSASRREGNSSDRRSTADTAYQTGAARSRSPASLRDSGNPLTQHSVTTEVMQTEYKTIEKELKYDKQTAVSACDGSGREGTSSSKHGVDTGYQSMRSSAPVTLQDDNDLYSKGQGTIGLERPGFKTREEFQRDFERREKELKEVLTRHSQKVEPQQDCLGTSTRSDPGMFEDSGNRWEYRISDQMNEFRRLEPEPAYPDDRLRCSRSKSDTDLVALSPTESQRYSSPMQPGARFLEFSTQQSPIFAHHDSMTYQTRGEPSGVLADRLRVPTIREQRQIPISKELPKVYDRRPVLSTQEHPMRPLEPVESHMRPIEPWEMLHDLRSADLEADPRKIGNLRKASKETSMNERSKSPLSIRQKEMEAELVKLNEELSEQVNDIHEEKPEENFEDNFPPSKKAQALRQVLEQEYMENLPPNINDMWTRFKERTEQSVTDSSLNSTRLDALSGLLQNPTHHDVNSFMEMTVKHRQEDAEKVKQLREERFTENEVERKKIAAEKATQQRNLRRQKMKNRQGLSEEESNGSYSEIISENEKNEQRRKKDGVREEQREKKHIKTKLPSKRSSEMACEERRKDRERNDRKAKVASKAPTEMSREERKKDRNRKTTEECSITDIRAKHSDTMDTLFSIPEDASFEQSPSKVESEMKSKQRRYRHVIDPLMKKLRDKIKLQRDKIDKERRKELQRVQKLKKLEMLLNAKRKGKLSDKAIDVELGDVSSTTTISHTESSKSSFTCLSSTGESDLSSQGSKTLSSHGSTTLKDSTVDSAIILQVKKYSPEEFRGCKTVQSDSTESSDFSNIIVERIPKMKSKRKGKDKKIGNNNEVNEFGRKRRRENKEKRQKAVFGVELTDKDIVNQIQRYDNFMSPERRRLMRVQNYSSPQRQGHVRDAGIMYPSENYLSPQLHRHMRDASTMYPSPITVSPPSRRRMREVLMKSEAIQTSPSIRTSSPTHAYDEVPITPVPYMSRGNCKMSKRRPSPSPTRSSQTSFSASPPRKTSKSPTTRKSSMSPSARKVSSSPPRRRFSPPITRRQAQSPIWKPESEIIPPQNSMFTPEGDENTAPNTCAEKDVQTWFIPMKPSQPWRQPLKERQAFSVRQEAWEPKSVSQSTWKGILHGDVLKDKGDPSDISRDTKFDLDPEGQPIGEDETLTDSDDELGVSKFRPLSKMTLQQAFQVRKGIAISRLRERQKRLNLATVQRKMEAFLQTERERLFQEERRTEANPDAHPYSEHLHKPGRRVISKEEMKEMTKKRYKKLPEILEQQSMKKRQDEYSLNRIKARLFNRRIQKKVLVKADKWGR